MQLNKNKAAFCLATSVGLLVGSAQAAQKMPATMEEMWKIIQQQQKEIEVLKSKAAQSEALKEEVSSLKESQKEQSKVTQQTAPAEATASSKTAKSEVERKTDILASEVERLKTQMFIPETREYKSEFGLGPAASQVYRVNRGLSIGGYGEAKYTNYTANKGSDRSKNRDEFDLVRAVLYAGYKFNDWIILNNEIEFEHASTGKGGEVSVEFSQLDFLLHRNANIRAGLMLMPMGFINEMHEPTTFHGNNRPDVERFIIPSTWRELGAGLFGEIVPGLQYRMYAVNGLRADRFGKGGIRDARQSGARALSENFAFTGRLDYTPDFAPGLLVGASTYLGGAGQDKLYNGKEAEVFTQLYEGHVQWHYRGLELRALGAWGHIGDADLVSAQNKTTVGKENFGWYTEAAYDIMPLLWKSSTQYLAPFLRYERYDTIAQAPDGFADDAAFDRRIYQGGLTYKPIPNVSVKADYRNISAANGQRPHEFNLGVGFIY